MRISGSGCVGGTSRTRAILLNICHGVIASTLCDCGLSVLFGVAGSVTRYRNGSAGTFHRVPTGTFAADGSDIRSA